MRSAEGRNGWFRLLLLGAILGVFAFAANACGDDEEEEAKTPTGKTPAAGETITIKKGDKIRIGISTTLSGDNAELGIPIRDTALLAIREKGTLKGFEIEGVPEDDQCSGPGSEAAAQKLIAEDVVAIMGPMCSGGAVAALDDYDTEDIVVVSSSTTASSVTQQGRTNFVRVAWNDATQGDEMAKFAFSKLNRTKAVLVNDQSTYGKGLMDVFKASFDGLGGDVLSEEAVTVGEKDFSAVVTKIKGQDPDIVVFGGFIAEGAALVRQLRDAGVEADFMGADGIADQDFIDQAAGGAEDAYVSRGPTPEQSTRDEILSKYKAEYGEGAGTQFVEQTWDAMQVIFQAIEKVATTDSDGNLVINRQQLIDAVKSATIENGASGTIKFNEVGDRVISPGVVNRIEQVKSGAFVKVQ